MNKSKAYSETKLLWLTRIADFLAPAVVAWIAIVAWLPQHFSLFDDQYFLAMATSSLLVANIFQTLNLYSIRSLSNVPRQIGRVTVAWTGVLALLIAVAFVTKVSANFPRGWAILWYAWTLGSFIAVRFVVAGVIGRWMESGRLTRDIAVVGAGPHGRRLIQHLHEAGAADYRIVGVFDDRAARELEPIEGVPVLGTVDDLIDYARHNSVDQIVVALP